MPNTLGIYDPIFYAQEALIQLEKALGMAGRVYRGVDKAPQQKGSVIQIRRPGTFTAQAMPGTAQDLKPDMVSVTLDQWQGVTFGLTDQELTYTTEQIVTEHIRPAAYAVADAIDLTLVGLYNKVPWYVAGDASGKVEDITGLWQVLFDNASPMDDLHLMLNGERTAKYLALQAFAQYQGAGPDAVAAVQQRASLGQKYGFEVFSNQNTPLHVTVALTNVGGWHLHATTAKGATKVTVDAGTSGSGTLKAGDIIKIAGNTQQYVVTADTAAAGDAFTDLPIYPALVQEYPADAVVTITQSVSKYQSMAFHRNAFALAMAPLSDMGNNIGARIATVADPKTGLSLRSRVWYEGSNAKVLVSIDALWGFQILNPNMACRLGA